MTDKFTNQKNSEDAKQHTGQYPHPFYWHKATHLPPNPCFLQDTINQTGLDTKVATEEAGTKDSDDCQLTSPMGSFHLGLGRGRGKRVLLRSAEAPGNPAGLPHLYQEPALPEARRLCLLATANQQPGGIHPTLAVLY